MAVKSCALYATQVSDTPPITAEHPNNENTYAARAPAGCHGAVGGGGDDTGVGKVDSADDGPGAETDCEVR